MTKLAELKDKYLERETVSEAIYHALFEAIETGVLTPGSRILEVELAEQMKVSRTPVREAIRWLMSDGLVVYNAHGNVCVKEFSINEISNIISAMESIRTICTKEAAEVIGKVALSRLKDILNKIDELDTLYEDDDERAHQRYLLDNQFHYVICEAIGNSYIMDFYNRLILFFKIILNTTEFRCLAFAYKEEANVQRKEIYEALKNHDGDLALQVALQHSQMLYSRIELLTK